MFHDPYAVTMVTNTLHCDGPSLATKLYIDKQISGRNNDRLVHVGYCIGSNAWLSFHCVLCICVS